MSSLDFLELHPLVRQVAVDKARGVILGGALGDVLGLYTEWLPARIAAQFYKDPIEAGITHFLSDQHRDRFSHGCWTDDTDHALLLVLSVLHHYSEHKSTPPPSVLAKDFAARIACWCEQGLLALNKPPLGLGRTIADVAMNPKYLADPHALAREKWMTVVSGDKPAANGSLMRTHPVGLLAVSCATDEAAYALAAEVSSVTHADPRCTLACCTAVGLVRGIIRGDVLTEQDLDRALEKTKTWIKTQPQLYQPTGTAGRGQGEGEGEGEGETDPFTFLRLDDYDAHTGRDATLESLELDDAMKMGYVYKCLGSAIVTLRAAMRESVQPDTFARHMRALVMEGGDADTNGSVAGSLLGAWVGASRLPGPWIENLTDSQWLLSKTRRYVAAVGLRDPEGEQDLRATPKDADADIHGGREPLTKRERDARERELLFVIMTKSAARERGNTSNKESKLQRKRWWEF